MDKKDPISRTFHFLAGALFLSNLNAQKGPNFSYVPVPGRELFFSATYLGKKDQFVVRSSCWQGPFFSQQLIWAKRTPFLVRSSSWQGPFFLSNLSAQKDLAGAFFPSNLTGQKEPHVSYVLVPGRGHFFSATYLDKKDPISRTFQFLAGVFFSEQLIWAKRAPFLVRSSSWQGTIFLSNLSAHKGLKRCAWCRYWYCSTAMWCS